ncbi:putative ATP-binding domain protein [Escherichia coli EPECa12]|nr:putative ATP-binding domain protein [Escherichia coli EPECa12]
MKRFSIVPACMRSIMMGIIIFFLRSATSIRRFMVFGRKRMISLK